MKVTVIIVAAGTGKRMGSEIPKQLLLINNKPILYYSIKAFNDHIKINDIIIVTNQSIKSDVLKIVRKYKFNKVSSIILGGKERQNSVWAGLKLVDAEGDDIILIHDSVRPLISNEFISKIISGSIKHKACVPGLPIKETIKMSEDGNYFQKTIDRKNLWSIQTPQGFKYSLIKKAFEQANANNFLGTDDSSLLERIGIKPFLVQGLEENLKITTPNDLLITKLLMKKKS